VAECEDTIERGATEIDMVMNIGAAKEGNWDLVSQDIEQVVTCCKEQNAEVLVKVILETCLLKPEEIEQACRICVRVGADYVKTSTGFSSAGANEEVVALMSKTVQDECQKLGKANMLGVKASGGVADYASAVKMIRAGATRIGASKSVKIVSKL
jgi:deoxyribose-phosphate aldolase